MFVRSRPRSETKIISGRRMTEESRESPRHPGEINVQPCGKYSGRSVGIEPIFRLGIERFQRGEPDGWGTWEARGMVSVQQRSGHESDQVALRPRKGARHYGKAWSPRQLFVTTMVNKSI
ncbi:hypothetical protein GWI33_014626 [Rhynchophorus ferrugineus]|uniref:Uncharacterized protein n=1 Tax=Rhynchophorus ferrugineus TaxID=354439 RepID=A0A834I460_RHYFE|nr:hypothetical protein GWI33_014626 [Rhynchophorus ferrugineus]